MKQHRTDLNRRQFFTRSAMAAGASALGGGVFDALVARAAFASDPQGRGQSDGYGPLRAAVRDGAGGPLVRRRTRTPRPYSLRLASLHQDEQLAKTLSPVRGGERIQPEQSANHLRHGHRRERDRVRQ